MRAAGFMLRWHRPALPIEVATGRFAADMQVHLVNDNR